MTDTEKRAHIFAQSTTSARCARMGDCKGCPIRFCDYKSRYEAWLQGHEAAAEAPRRKEESDPNKKRCTKCGRSLYRDTDFYNRRQSYCKECMRAYGRDYQKKLYAARRAKNQPFSGVRRDPRTGTLYEWRNGRKRTYWSPAMLEKLKRIYPVQLTADVAIEVGVSECLVMKKAAELGLRKSKEFMRDFKRKTLETARFYRNYIGKNNKSSNNPKK